MSRLVTLRDFLKEYDITKEAFMKEIKKDEAFYDKYIEWEQFDDATIISPKALVKLGEAFEPETEKMTITVNGEVKEEVSIKNTSEQNKEKDFFEKAPEEVKPKRKRRTKAEMEAERKNQIDMSEFMDMPAEENKETKPEKPKAASKPRKKKSKNNITKQFIQENGRYEMKDSTDLKSFRSFLMNNGLYKAEQLALMEDKEIIAVLNKDYFAIDTEERTYFFERKALGSISGSTYVIEKK